MRGCKWSVDLLSQGSVTYRFPTIHWFVWIENLWHAYKDQISACFSRNPWKREPSQFYETRELFQEHHEDLTDGKPKWFQAARTIVRVCRHVYTWNTKRRPAGELTSGCTWRIVGLFCAGMFDEASSLEDAPVAGACKHLYHHLP